ncbi:MAG: ABC transporter permease [Bacillota bacterium]
MIGKFEVSLGKTQRKNIKDKIRKWPELGALIAFLVIFITFAVIAPKFVSLNNIAGVLTISSELGIMAIGIAFLMIAGEFDLSVSSVYAFSGFLFVMLANSINSILAFFLALAVAGVIGLINGKVTIKTKIPSFIATLGMMMFIRGLLLGLTGGSSVVYKGDNIMPRLLIKYVAAHFRPSHIWFVFLIILMSIVLTKTPYGNWVYATGGKKEVARTMGVDVDKVKLINFIICSILAGFAGIIAITRFKVANASFGTQMELEAIASAVIGGTLMTGGFGTILGAALGAIIMGMLRSGLVMAGAPSYWYEAFVGVILIIAATINLKLRTTS